MEQETIRGFDIPKRELTEEEATRDVTYERIRDFHHEVGEEFFDYNPIVNYRVFGGFLLHKYPHLAKEILEILNAKFSDTHDFTDIYENEDGEDVQFYRDACELINLTTFAKKEANQVLIQIAEHYGTEETDTED